MQNISSVCLICLTTHNTSKVVCRFGHDEQENFKYVFPELVLPEPDIPAFICYACLTTLTNIASYKKKCAQNYLFWFNSVHESEEMCNTEINNNEETKLQISNTKTLTENELKATAVPELQEQQSQSTSSKQNYTKNKQLYGYNTRKKNKILQTLTNPKEATVISENTNYISLFIKNDSILDEYFSKNENKKTKNKFVPNYKQTSVEKRTTNISKSKKSKNTNTNKISKPIKNTRGKIDPNMLLKCPFCDKQVLVGSVGQHLSTHLSTYGDYECPICKEKCSHESNLARHMHIHSQYKCIICSLVFTDESNFTEHTKTHKGIYLCEICNNDFSCEKRIMFNQQTGKYKCEFCAFDLVCQPKSDCIFEWGEPSGAEYINIY